MFQQDKSFNDHYKVGTQLGSGAFSLEYFYKILRNISTTMPKPCIYVGAMSKRIFLFFVGYKSTNAEKTKPTQNMRPKLSHEISLYLAVVTEN